MTTRTTEDMHTGTWRTFRPVIDAEKCVLCYSCWKFCPDLSMIVREEGDYPSVDLLHCKGCGICANECRPGAITMEREPL
ncbi:MAG: 4Fe-4S binding protein [Methanomassiliicoccaceae archaeon]|nr:4Fe-4S binding protein [Methanomassiliicoccaceae archaeon]HOQ25527.1 4Fe-4S binding protein [Methanomassiliicoccaceae archaeon]HPP45667.1 4Fe-4S binding protein [Methanomassiliicoccaceae archaeon]HQA22068.1 4Fe-4S binding protein [Methanomassiliicoccaceae archaeon]HQD87735.1 4Fe-4S binding protein [Methanomassiliicoccaceae archaeon]